MGEEAMFSPQLMIQTPRQEGANVLTVEALQQHLDSAIRASRVHVYLFNRQWKLEHLCYKSGELVTEAHFMDQIIEKLHPCLIITPLDCFWEGAKLQSGMFYLPCVYPPLLVAANHTQPQLLDTQHRHATGLNRPETLGCVTVSGRHIAGICFSPARGLTPLSGPSVSNSSPLQICSPLPSASNSLRRALSYGEMMYCGLLWRLCVYLTYVLSALQTMFQLMTPKQMFEHLKGYEEVSHINWNQDKAAAILEAWQRKYSEVRLCVCVCTVEYTVRGALQREGGAFLCKVGVMCAFQPLFPPSPPSPPPLSPQSSCSCVGLRGRGGGGTVPLCPSFGGSASISSSLWYNTLRL
ncbi:unnamed protein product [Oncorhynchus mykiss]|uniref:Uncharacterized protein n=1 Tax=Oncorhynchus mykiss TaxID=8022 RepID=A0A060YVA2_ONCMY|nr:unnamed protein product [Oncorhynchus mykiss]